MIAGTGKIINRSEISQSGGHALRVGLTNIATGNAPQFYVYPLDAEFSYTSIGTCASGRLRFADPVGWEPYSYLLRVQIYNNSTWETVFLSTHKGGVQQGNIYEVQLVSIWEVVRGDFVDKDMLTTYGYPRIVGLAMDIPSVIGNMIIGGKMNSQIEIGYGMTWEQFFQTKYDEVTDAQWGYTPDNKFIAGVPGDFTALTYEHDGRTLEAESQGFSDLDYLTAYKGYDADLIAHPTISESRSIGSLIPRKTEVLSWDASRADRKVEYSWTRTFTVNETINSGDGFVQVEFGSGEIDPRPSDSIAAGRVIVTRVRIDGNLITQSYDDITDIVVSIKYTGFQSFRTHTFDLKAIAWMGYVPPSEIQIWRYGLLWDYRYGNDENGYQFLYPIPRQPTQRSFYDAEFMNQSYTPFQDNVAGLLWSGSLKKLKEMWQSNSYYTYREGDQFDPPDLRTTYGVSTSFDQNATGSGMVVEVNVSMTLRNESAGWVIPPGFASEAYGGPAYRLFLNGLFAPPLVVDNGVLQQNLAGSTVRVTSAQGVTTEALTGVLPAGQFRRRR